MIPGVVDAPVDEAVEPFFGEEVVDIGLAEAGGDAGEEFLVEAVAEAAEGAVEDVFAAAAEVAGLVGAFDADEGGAIAELAEFLGGLFGDHLAVGEDLKVAVGVLGEEVEEAGVEEGFAAEDTEEAITVLAGVVDEAVEFVEFDEVAGGVDVDPAALAAEVAAVDDAEVEEGGEDDAFFKALFEEVDGAGAFESEIPRHGAEEAGVDRAGDAGTELKDHGFF